MENVSTAWQSPRAIIEQQTKADAENRRLKIESFDRLIDLALVGQITLEEAVEAYKFDGTIYTPTVV